jgi:hypothetical protein
MGILINSDDFKTGDTIIAGDAFTIAKITSAISVHEKQILSELLGVELCALFILDLSAGVPQTAKYLAIYNAFIKQDEKYLYSSIGMKELVKKWVRFHFVRTQPQSNTIQGNTISPGTIATPSIMSFTSLVLDYNKMIESYHSIQYFIEENIADYPTYKGIKKESMSWA